MQKLWRHILNAGIYPDTKPELVARLKLSNVLGILLGALLLVFAAILYTPLFRVLYLVVGLLFWSIPLLSMLRWHLAGRLLLTVGLTTLLLFAGTAYAVTDVDIDYHFKLYLFALAIFPLAMYGPNENGWKVLAVVFPIVAYFGFDWFDANFNVVPGSESSKGYMTYDLMRGPVVLFAFLLLVGLFGFFQQFDEYKLRNALDDAARRGEELKAREAELQDALESAAEAQAELSAQSERLEESRQEAEARAASLQSTRESLRRIVKRLRANQVELESQQTALRVRQMQDSALTELALRARMDRSESLELWAERTLETMMAHLPQVQAALYLHESDRLRRLASYAYHYVNGSPAAIELGYGLAGEVAHSRQAQIIEGLRERDIRIRAGGLLVVQPDSLMAFPLLYRDDLVGVLEVTCLHALEPELRELLDRMVEQLGSHLHSARVQIEVRRLLDESQHRAEELLAQEEELRQNIEELEATQDEMKRVQNLVARQEANLNALINNTLDNIVLIDREFKVVVVNEAVRQRYASYGVVLRAGLSVFEAMSSEQTEVWRGYYEQALSGQRLNFTGMRVEHGREYFIDYWVNPIFGPDQQIIGVSVFSRDVTDRVVADRQVRESEVKLKQLNENLEAAVRERTAQVHTNYAALRTTLETTSEGICVVDNKNKIWDFNYQFAEIWQLPPEIISSRENHAMMEHIRSQVKNPEEFDARLQDILANQPEETTGLLELLDGRIVMVYSQRPRREVEQSQQGVSRVWSYRDVTEQQRAARALQESEARLRTFFDLSNEGVFLHDKSIIIDANPALARILGEEVSKVIGASVVDFIHPEDLEVVRERVRIGYSQPYEIRLMHSSGRVVYCEVLSKGLSLQATDGQSVKAVFVRDLTERKQAEDTLQTIARALPVATLIVSYQKPTILWQNENATQLSGYTVAEAIGMRTKHLYESEAEMMRMTEELLRNQGSLRNFEMAFKRKDGSLIWVVVSGERLVYQGQNAVIFGFYDITERRRSEEAQMESKRQLEDAFEELRRAKTQLALSDKLALMGQLTAGIAHEINTPLGAAFSSAQGLLPLTSAAVDQLSQLASALPKGQLNAVKQFIHAAQQAPSNLSTREERQLRAQWTETLNAEGIDQPEEPARLLAELRYSGPITPLVPLFQGKQRGVVIAAVRSIAQLATNVDNINVAHNKARRVVSALKRFTHTGNLDTIEPVSIVDTLNTILILYAHAIRSKGRVETDFDGEPVVMANPDTLGQVWTNLITNALQAMSSNGTLGIRVRTVKDHTGSRAVVQISDTGTGIPPEVLPRIFDPFFTTKKKGEGTGMGLQIVRQIIETYRGTIGVTSEPGNTVFTIELPLATAEQIAQAGEGALGSVAPVATA